MLLISNDKEFLADQKREKITVDDFLKPKSIMYKLTILFGGSELC